MDLGLHNKRALVTVLRAQAPASARPGDKAVVTADGLRAHQFHLVPSAAERALTSEQRTERDRLELDLAALRTKRQQLGEAAYYEQVEALLVRLARLYAAVSSGE